MFTWTWNSSVASGGVMTATDSVVVGLVVSGQDWNPSADLQEEARTKARVMLERALARLGLSLHGEPSEQVEDDEWGGVLLTLTARGLPA